MKRYLLGAALVVAGFAGATAAGAAPKACASNDAGARREVEATIRAWYAAEAKDDAEGARRLTAPSFYAYDVGQRFEGQALSDRLRDAHAKGVVLEWNFNRVDVHVSCDMAWAAWENHGRVGSAAGMQPMNWQESAALRRGARGWVLEFLHSNRVEPAKPAAGK